MGNVVAVFAKEFDAFLFFSIYTLFVHESEIQKWIYS